MRQLKFPTYEYIKALPKEDSCGCWLTYEWTLFETPTDTYGRIIYNEDDDGFIFFDVMEDGYCDHNTLGLAVIFNEENYEKLRHHAQTVFESFYTALDRDCSAGWDDYYIECE